MSSVETTIRNEVCEIAQVVLQLERLAAAQNLPPASVWPLNVALDEVLSNIINYGYTDAGEHRIQIRIALEQELVVAEVEDDGIAFDPLGAPPPCLDGDATTRPITSCAA
jgi:serine/threonine-protein kinase RsbW